jgi:hypothetical protein
MAKYSKKTQDHVEKTMRRKKKGTLKSGSGQKVKSREQAVAIALSEAREKGYKAPKKVAKKSAAKKSSAKKGGAKKSTAKKTAKKSATSSGKKSTAKKAAKRPATKKSSGRKRSPGKKK